MRFESGLMPINRSFKPTDLATIALRWYQVRSGQCRSAPECGGCRSRAFYHQLIRGSYTGRSP